jgi:two-component system, LytTR family, response regulator
LHRILVVEDEPLARKRLLRLIETAPGVAPGSYQVTEAANGIEALRRLAEDAPDIVFLDVQMPGLSGLDVLEQTPDRRFEIVFVTAHQEHALRAFDEGACDYVLKPYRPDRLYAALERATRRAELRAHLPDASSSAAGRVGEQLSVREATGIRVIPLAEIVGFMSQDHYTVVYLRSGEECLSEQSLASLEDKLDPATFVRAHRKSIVRLDAVRTVGVGPNPRIELVTGLSVPLARAKRRAFVDRIRTDG